MLIFLWQQNGEPPASASGTAAMLPFYDISRDSYAPWNAQPLNALAVLMGSGMIR